MKKVVVFMCLISALFIAVSVWYFGHHRHSRGEIGVGPAQVNQSTPPIAQKSPLINQQLPKEGPTPVDVSDKSSTSTTPDKNPNTSTMAHMEAGVVSRSDDKNTVTPKSSAEHTEGTHNHLSEEAEFAALMKEVFLERKRSAEKREETIKIKERSMKKLSNMLNSYPIEEQRSLLMQTKNLLFNPPTTSLIESLSGQMSSSLENFDHEAFAKKVWNDFMTDLIKSGYTPPEGIEIE